MYTFPLLSKDVIYVLPPTKKNKEKEMLEMTPAGFTSEGFRAESSKGPSINDITLLFHIFGPPPPCHCSKHATYQYCIVTFWTPPPLEHDVIYGWSL